jgi:GMP synthase (glutamine-hydrolysing)
VKKLLIVEGNLREENISFTEVGIQTHTESLKDSLNYYTKDLKFDVVNPSSDESLDSIKNNLAKYDGLIWGGSSLNIYNDTPEIRKQIEFMKECQKKVKNILAICWGMQVAVTAAGGEVKKADGSHIGIANEIIINKDGLTHPLYKNKENKFNSPAFNFDEVKTLPKNAICLASNKINKVQSLYFKVNNTNVWGLQYHPEITYEKMISLIEFRKDRLIENRKVFKSESDVKNHVSFIKNEISISNKEKRMVELKNWLNSLN